MALTVKQERFVQEYLIDLNATQAAIRAGYSESTANQQGSRLLANVKISDAVAAAQVERQRRMGISQDRVLQELARIGFSDIRKAVKWGATPGDPDHDDFEPSGSNIYPVSLVPSDQVDDDTAAAITEVSLTQAGVKLKMADKRAALETMLRHMSGDDGADAPELTINVKASDPIGEVRVTRHNG